MFDEDNLRSHNEREPGHSYQLLRKYGYADGILKKLATEADVSDLLAN